MYLHPYIKQTNIKKIWVNFYYTPLGFQARCTDTLWKSFGKLNLKKEALPFHVWIYICLRHNICSVWMMYLFAVTTCMTRKDRTVSRQTSTNLPVYEFWPTWLMPVLEVSVLSMVHVKLATVMLCYKVVVMVRCLGCWPSLITLIFFLS